MAQRKSATEAAPITLRIPNDRGGRMGAARLYVLLCYNPREWNRDMRRQLEQILSREEISRASVNHPEDRQEPS